MLTSYPAYTVVRGSVVIPTVGDFDLIVDINGKKIGIESMGDPNTNLQERLLELVDKHNCDVIICSTRTKGETVYAVDYLYNNRNFETIWTSTYRIASSASQIIANKIKGKNILTLLQALSVI